MLEAFWSLKQEYGHHIWLEIYYWCFEQGTTSYKAVLWRSQEESKRNFQRRLVLCIQQSPELWNVSPKDDIDVKSYMGSREDKRRTQKRNTLRITDSINHVKWRKSTKNSWNFREYLGFLLHVFRCSVVQCYSITVLMMLCAGAAAEEHPDSYMDYVQGAHVSVLCNRDHMAPHEARA